MAKPSQVWPATTRKRQHCPLLTKSDCFPLMCWYMVSPTSQTCQYSSRHKQQSEENQGKHLPLAAAKHIRLLVNAHVLDVYRCAPPCQVNESAVNRHVMCLKCGMERCEREVSQTSKIRPAHGACIRSILHLWAVVTYLATASDISSSLGHTTRQ